MIGALLAPRFLPYIAVAIGVLGAAWWLYDLGYDNGVAKVEAQIQKELERQQEVNNLALAEARKREEQLLADNAALMNKANRLRNAAAQDPHANRVCLSPGSVQRLNSVE